MILEIFMLASNMFFSFLVVYAIILFVQNVYGWFTKGRYRNANGFFRVYIYEVFIPKPVYLDMLHEMGRSDEPILDRKTTDKIMAQNRKAILSKLKKELKKDRHNFMQKYVYMYYEGDEAQKYVSDFLNQYMIKYKKTAVAIYKACEKMDSDYPFGQWFIFRLNNKCTFDIPISKVKMLTGTTKDWTIVLEGNVAYNVKNKKLFIRNVPSYITDPDSIMAHLLLSSSDE